MLGVYGVARSLADVLSQLAGRIGNTIVFPLVASSQVETSEVTARFGGVRLKALAAAIKARWICEQAHQQLKEELGLDHFEGRSWTGLHRHALMTMIAYAFLQSRRLKTAKREKKESPDHPRNQPCQPSGKPSSTPS